MTDYTNRIVGTKLNTGKIDICTYCGRVGLVKSINGKIFVTHFEGITPSEEGDAQIWDDECPKKGIPLKPSNPESH